jgi:transposase
MAEREDKTVGQVARELGRNASMLARWRSETRRAQESEIKVFPGNGNPRDEEPVRLRKRVAELEEANEILKKAAVIFAKAPLR